MAAVGVYLRGLMHLLGADSEINMVCNVCVRVSKTVDLYFKGQFLAL